MNTYSYSVNVNNCKVLLNYMDEFPNDFKTLIKSDVLKNQENKLSYNVYVRGIKTYLHSVINNEHLSITYKHPKNANCGRLYSDKFSIQNLHNKLKGFILQDVNANDYDIVNCHFVLLRHYCKLHDIECEQLNYYIENRNDFFLETKKNKFDIICILNSDINNSKKTRLFNFISELSIIKNKLVSLHPELSTTNTKNPISSKVNKLLCKLENEIINKVIKKLNIKKCILMFDGIITFEKYKLEDLNEITKMYDINWIRKDFNTIDIIDPNNSYDNTKSYESVKITFEKQYFMILNPVLYCLKNSKGNLLKYTKRDFCDIVAPYKYVDNMGQEQSFFNKWITDEDRRTYDTLDYIPYNEDIKQYDENEDSFNIFKPFKYKKTNDKIDISLFTEFFKKMIPETDKHDYYIKYLSHLIQKPSERPDICCILSGEQGSGKGTICENIIKKLIGADNYQEIDSVNDICGNFNSLVGNKLFISINEMTGSDGLEFKDKLKSMITANTLNINEKNVKQVIQTNYSRFCISTNNISSVCVEKMNRRYILIKTGHALIMDKKKNKKDCLFNKLNKQLNEGDLLQGIYNYLVNYDITDYDPKFDADKLLMQKTTADHPLFEFLQSKNIIDYFKKDAKTYYIDKSLFYTMLYDFIENSEDIEKTENVLNSLSKSMILKLLSNKLFFSGTNRKVQINNKRTQVYHIKIEMMDAYNDALEAFNICDEE